MPEQFHIARIVAAHGLRGEVKIACFLENPKSLERYNPLVTKKGKACSVRVTGSLKDHVIARIEGVDDRSAAELLKGTELYADAAKLPPINDNQFYHNTLIGLRAVTADGTKIGTLVAIHNYGAGDILEIDTGDDEELLLPFKDPFVLDVDVAAGIVTVTPPDYTGEE